MMFLGHDVLTFMPHYQSDPERDYARSMILQDATAGLFTYIAASPTPIITTTFGWLFESRADIDAFRTFLLARQGQLAPFWVPTWKRDFTLALPVLSTDASLTVDEVGYARMVFGNAARQYLAVIAGDQMLTAFEINAATSNGDGTETLGLTAAAGIDIPLGAFLSYLTFSRFATDDVATEFASFDVAECEISLVEVPREVPTL